MKKTLIIIVLLACSVCKAQTIQTFTELLNLFPEMKFPLKYKDGIPTEVNVEKVSKEDAVKYLHFTGDDLQMNDYSYDHDEDIKYDNWVEVLPGALGKISKTNYVALVYVLAKYPTLGLESYVSKLSTFSYEGQHIDSIVIRSRFTRENDWTDIVFLNNNTFKVFQYQTNIENYDIRNNTYYLIDENLPRTVVDITDYHIDENGKIKILRTYPKQYLKDEVIFYRHYRRDSDDPMNEY